MCNVYAASCRIVATTGTGPCVIVESSFKTSVNVQWIECMWPYFFDYAYFPVTEWTPSINITVNVQWISVMSPYCWHYGYWPVSEANIFLQDKCECAMDIRHVAVLLSLLVLAHE